MKFYSIVLVVGVASASISADVLEAEQIVNGLLNGAIKAEGFTDFLACETNTLEITNDAKTVVADLKAGGAKNIMNGLETIADMLLWARNAGVVCNPKTSADWARLNTMAADLKNPKSFIFKVGKDLYLNGEDITNELAEAIGNY